MEVRRARVGQVVGSVSHVAIRWDKISRDDPTGKRVDGMKVYLPGGIGSEVISVGSAVVSSFL